MRKILLSLAVSEVLLNGWANERALIADDYSNYFSTAKEIPLNMQIEGSIETAGDIDIFKFTLDKDDGVNIYGNSGKYGIEYWGELYIIKKETIETLSDYLNEESWDIRGDVQYNIKNVLQFSFNNNNEIEKTLNMSKGNYYIVLMGISESTTTPYTFRIESTENNGSVTLDKVTLEYCKTHLEECGLSVNSELKYTQSDLDSAKDEIRNQLKLSKEKIETLGSGWNMVGTGEAISTSELNGEIWSYENGSWSHNPNELKAFSGFWIKK